MAYKVTYRMNGRRKTAPKVFKYKADAKKAVAQFTQSKQSQRTGWYKRLKNPRVKKA